MHFIGIGGIGMSGIAEILINLGYEVSGSDLRESEQTRRLASLGAKIFIGHSPSNISDYHVVVTSSAINPGNPELIEARKREHPGHPPVGDAGRAGADEARHRRGRDPRQDHHHLACSRTCSSTAG